jgi:NodT family efflux transporter outer membrane factor (OMF) lipoprotein
MSAVPRLLLLAIGVAAAGCSLMPTYRRPEVGLPAQWDATVATPSTTANAQAEPADWWEGFGSAELDELMTEALASNHDLAAAVARVDEARAAVSVARAGLLPTVDAGASATRDRHAQNRGTTNDTSQAQFNQAQLSIGYEVDLWGRVRAGSAAASARANASEYDRDSASLVLQGEVATSYLSMLALRDRLTIAHDNLDAARELLHLVEVRFNNGAASALDVAQQRTVLLGIAAEIPSLEQSLSEASHALAVLLGRNPQGFDIDGRSLSDVRLPAVDVGTPADLLDRRPDIRGAEARLIAANADVGAARAALLPQLNLSATAGVASALSGGSASVATVAASLAQTIFAGGRLHAELQASEAVKRELTETYVQAVLTSLGDVANGRSALATTEQRDTLLAQTASEARNAYRLARIRYDAGAADLLTLLDSERSRLDAEDGRVQAQFARYTATVDLIKALGG